MGFLDKIVKAFGFESENPEKVVKPTKIESAYTGAGAQFQLEEEKQVIKEEKQPVQEQPSTQGLSVETPKTQKEVQTIIDNIKDGKTVIVNLTGFNATDRTRALDFLSGALYSMRGKIQILDGNLYLLSL